MNDLPEPLTPADCDLRDFPYMPLDVARLRDSKLKTAVKPDRAFFAVLLWCASWHQIPAASLPDDDAELANLAGFGFVVKEWKKHRDGALYGWVKCNDGRLYHPVVAEKALDAWAAKHEQRYRTECARIKKHNQRHGTSIEFPTIERFLSPSYVDPVLWDKSKVSPGTDATSPSGNGIQEKRREEKGREEKKKEKQNTAPATPPVELPDWLPPETWQAFVDMRRKMRKPMTDHAAALLIAELGKLMQAGHRPRLVLEQSIMNSWQGVFALKAPRLLGDAQSREAFNERENAKAKELLFGPEDEHAAG